MTIIDFKKATSLQVHQQRDVFDATALSEPDPNWLFVDAAGHQHRWSKAGNLRTLKHVVDEWGYDEWDGERYPLKTHHECRKCGEHVIPGTRPGRPMLIPGLRSWNLEAKFPMDEELWETLISAIHTGERCLLRFPEAVGAKTGYVMSVQMVSEPEGGIEVSIRGDGPA